MYNFLRFEKNELGQLQCFRVPNDKHIISYETLREAVGNTIQYVYHVDLGDERLVLVVDEEGLLKQLKPTFWLYSEEKNVVYKYPLVGGIFVVKLVKGDSVCLTEEDIDKVKSKVMVDKKSGMYFLPLNDEYIKRSNENMNAFLKLINEKE